MRKVLHFMIPWFALAPVPVVLHFPPKPILDHAIASFASLLYFAIVMGHTSRAVSDVAVQAELVVMRRIKADQTRVVAHEGQVLAGSEAVDGRSEAVVRHLLLDVPLGAVLVRGDLGDAAIGDSCEEISTLT